MLTLASALALAVPLQVQAPETQAGLWGSATLLGPGDGPQLNLAGDWLKFSVPSGDGVETFGLYLPPQPAATPAPLLVHFHASQGGHFEVGLYTDFIQEAEARGWFLVCPDQDVQGTNSTTYGSDRAQRRSEAVLRWALDTLPVDETRVYAYGFSMGGGDALSFAAQHLDPCDVTFAAIAQNAGTLCLSEEYRGNVAAAIAMFRSFGVRLGQDRYAYVRASTLDYRLDFSPAHDNAAVNLEATPVRSWFSQNERPALERYGADLDLLLQNHATIVGSSGSHLWSTFDFAAVCSWFDGQRLAIPQRGELLVARDARYHDIWVERDDADAFGRVGFDLSSPIGLRFTRLENVRSLRVDALVTGVPRSFGVVLEPDATSPLLLHVDGYGSAPSQVVRDGQIATPGAAWRMEGTTLVLVAPPGAVPGGTRWLVRD